MAKATFDPLGTGSFITWVEITSKRTVAQIESQPALYRGLRWRSASTTRANAGDDWRRLG
jgi:hypothetical protein